MSSIYACNNRNTITQIHKLRCSSVKYDVFEIPCGETAPLAFLIGQDSLHQPPHVILSSRSADNDRMQSPSPDNERPTSTTWVPLSSTPARLLRLSVVERRKKKEIISSKSRCLQNAPYCSRFLILPISFPISQAVNDWPVCVAGFLPCLGSTDLVLPGSRCERRPNISQRDCLRKRKYLRSSKLGRHD